MKKILQLILLVFTSQALAQEITKPQDRIISQTLSQRWELDSADKRGTFRLNYYKPFYITADRWSNNPNFHPQSENSDYSVPEASPYNNYDVKIQLSFKSYYNPCFGDTVTFGSQIPMWPIGRSSILIYPEHSGN